MRRSTNKKTRGKQVIMGMLATFIVIFLCLAAIEAFFRVIYFQPRGRVAVPYEFQLSEIAGIPYELTPNHNYFWKYGPQRLFDPGFSISVKINSSGYRDEEVKNPKPSNSYRILAIGDSFTWGLGVEAEDSWVEQLQSMLNDSRIRNPVFQDKRIEIINTGVGSWNTEVEYAFLKNKGIKLEPDAVILGFLSNDFRAGNTDFKIDERGFLTTESEGNTLLHLQSLLYEEEASKNIFRKLIESSHAIRWASGRRMRTEKQKLMVFNDKNSHTRTLAALEGIYNITKQAGIPFYVCIFPYVADVVPSAEKADLDIIAKHCRLLNIPALRMENALSGHTATKLWVHPKDHHPNATAHKLYAEYIQKYFFSNKNEKPISNQNKPIN